LQLHTKIPHPNIVLIDNYQMTQSAHEIAILFADNKISRLFHALLIARGANSRIVSQTQDIRPSEKIVTEVQFAKTLKSEFKPRCLVVGNEESEDCLGTLFLSRPLTEEKIDNILSQLFEV
jgi:hypothetical protein